MRFFIFVLMLSILLAQQFHAAASRNGSKRRESKTRKGFTFNSVYNLGLSSSQGKEILKRLNTVVKKLDEIQSKGTTKARCPPGWKVFKQSCFIAFKKPKASWNDARYVCKSLGGDLAKITSAAANHFAYGLIAGDLASLGYVYFGLKKGRDGRFYWVDGSSLASPFWDKGEPDGSGDCGIFWSGTASRRWHDSGSCNTKGGYICEMALTA